MKFNLATRGFAACAFISGGLASPLAAAAADANNAHVEGIVIGTYQSASRSDVGGQPVKDEANGQLYMLGTLDMGPGKWALELRGSTTPRNEGVSSYYGSNLTVGETVGPNGNGRIAATQLFYELPLGPGQLRVGLLDPTAVLDGNEVNADEYTQFLADAFVHNPTIGFPSFVLGAGYQGSLASNLDYHVFVTSSSGLEDDDATYGNVFDVGEDGKGVFTIGELDWRVRDYALQVGFWYDTADADRLDGPGHENAYGGYATVSGKAGPGRWSVRGGIANATVQGDANFVSAAYAVPIQVAGHDTVLGLAVARRGDSSHLPFDSAPIRQVEAYWRFHVMGTAYISPDIQYIDNAGFHKDRDGVVVGGARIGIEF